MLHDVPVRLLPERTGMMCFEYHPSVLSSAGNGWCLHKNRSHLSSRTSGGNKKLETRLPAAPLAGLYFQSSLNKRGRGGGRVGTGRKREQHLKSFPTAIALSCSLLPVALPKGGGRWLPREIRSFKRGAKAVAFNGKTGKYIDEK